MLKCSFFEKNIQLWGKKRATFIQQPLSKLEFVFLKNQIIITF